MSRTLIAAPAELAVPLDDVRLDLRGPAVELNPQITMHIKAATLQAEHATDRALITQTWRLTLDGFPDAIRMDGAPLVSVTSIQFYDTNEVLQTLDPADYMVDIYTEPGYAVPASGKAWPDTADRINAVMVTYVCGYGATSAAVPEAIQIWIRAKAVAMFEKEDPPAHIDGLLDRYRIYG